MDKYKARMQIEDTLDGVLFHDDVIDEIFDLVMGSGIERQFFKKLISNIELIKNLGSKAIENKNFEKLRDAEDLYSMKFKGKNMNLRMLFSYDVESSTIMLHCFYEREDSGKDRYSSHIPIAIKRKKEMGESYEKQD